jgi:hypothetical protein
MVQYDGRILPRELTRNVVDAVVDNNVETGILGLVLGDLGHGEGFGHCRGSGGCV